MKNAEARAKLYKHELQIRIDWLKDHITRADSVRVMRAAVVAWRRELIRKKQLLRELECGLPVSDREVRSRTNAARLLRSSAPDVEREYFTRPIKPGEFQGPARKATG
jgi:hypothetical protein